MTRRFATHGSDAFNAWMEERVAEIAADAARALGGNLVALVLGGGYARGEGGVVRVDGRELPYNDLDFTVIVRGSKRAAADALAEVSRKHHPIVGIDVDFSRPLTVDDVRRWPHWLMWTDLLAGHRVVQGAEDALTANAPARLKGSPPLIEGTRLLLNRGAGLLWASLVLAGAEPAPDPTFVERNLHKCALAIGDSLIIAAGRHRTRYEGRDAILAELVEERFQGFADMLAPYRDALRFRLEPGEPLVRDAAAARTLLAGRWRDALLETEGIRAGRSFAGAAEYAAWPALREPELHTPARRVKNLLLNARGGKLSTRYPRERLYAMLPTTLGASTGAPGPWVEDARAALALWRRYN
ncbi:MAG: hypothetical protein SF028_04255 [Candidatus Sumerlaeia bacterium]|nr:hypothetical protein [Candidatus Sumerlaeia bacterium]